MMPDENELEELTNDFLNSMNGIKEVDYHGRDSEQVKELGTLGECGRTGGFSGEDICKN